MSVRTLIELNHDRAAEIIRDPQAFVDAILEQLACASVHRRIPGGQILVTRHHSERVLYDWGADS